MSYPRSIPTALFALVLLALAVPAGAVNHWHVSTYWAEHLAGHAAGNHALYCGDETIPACAPPDTIGGVGPSWFDEVEWRSNVADPAQPTTVRLTGVMIYDLPDAGWDFLGLYVERGGELELLESWTGTHEGTVGFDYSAVLLPGEFSGPGGDEARLVWRVWTSADGWDDEDCINPSHGACQIDDLVVYLNGVLITSDDFEPGSPIHWDPVPGDLTAADDLPAAGQLAVAAHPNPFNPRTTIGFDLPRAAEVSLAVYDLQGRLVRELLAATRYPAGRHQQDWDGRDDRGAIVASGVYFYRFAAGSEHRTGKLAMLK